MAKKNILILILSIALAQLTACGAASLIDDGGRLMKTPPAGLRGLLGDNERAKLARSGDDFHSNIPLDKLNDVNRYDTSLAPELMIGDAQLTETDFNDLRDLILRLSNSVHRGSARMERKRLLPQLSASKEDKDYSFIGASGLANILDPLGVYDWRPQRAASQGFKPDSQPLDSELQISTRSIDDTRASANINEKNYLLMKDQIDKKGRCSFDPTMRVKNPFLCDTHKYFWATEGANDGWRAVGRRR